MRERDYDKLASIVSYLRTLIKDFFYGKFLFCFALFIRSAALHSTRQV